jgi:tripartite-type tricarboxylate transporter receptor subunit TctC
MKSRLQTNGVIAAAWLLVAAATTAWGQPLANGTETKPAQGFPSKPIRLIDPFPPGGGTWIVAHLIAQELLERWGLPVVVDNRGGAGGVIGSELAARAVPDGYTLVMATASTVVINPLVSKTPFDPVQDFAAVAHTTIIPLILVVHPLVAAKSVKELVALARSRPGKLNFASSGSGTISHLAGELFKITAGVDIVHVPYKGGGPALIDLVGGQVQLNFANMLSALPHVKAGRLRGLAVTSPRRAPAIRDMPTVAEAGVAGYDVVQWNGVLAPAGTPREIIVKLNREIGSILSLPDVRERLLSDGAETVSGTPQQFAAFIKADIAKWAKVIKAENIRSDR